MSTGDRQAPWQHQVRRIQPHVIELTREWPKRSQLSVHEHAVWLAIGPVAEELAARVEHPRWWGPPTEERTRKAAEWLAANLRQRKTDRGMFNVRG